MALMLAVFIYAASQILTYLRTDNENRKLYKDLIDKAIQITPEATETSPEATSETQTPATAPIEVDFETLWRENEDIVAWSYCEDTPIHYPVVQSSEQR